MYEYSPPTVDPVDIPLLRFLSLLSYLGSLRFEDDISAFGVNGEGVRPVSDLRSVYSIMLRLVSDQKVPPTLVCKTVCNMGDVHWAHSTVFPVVSSYFIKQH